MASALWNRGKVGRHLIYALRDPRDGSVRYIGKSSFGIERCKQHGAPAAMRKDRTHKGAWIRSLHRLGLSYVTDILMVLPDGDGLNDAEMRWIAEARELGWPLTNHTDGGGGLSGRKHSAEARAKMSVARKGYRPSEATRAKLREAHKHRAPLTSGARARMSASAMGRVPWNKGVPASDEVRAAVSVANTGRVQSAATRAKISRSLLGHEVSDATRAKLAAVPSPRKGGRLSDETRARMSAAQRLRAKMSASKRMASGV